MTEVSSERIHASCVAIGGRAVLLCGASGSGKSDLALRLIDRGAELVSDDQVLLTRDGDTLRASPPATIAGKIEVRGLGILAMPHRTAMPVSLLIQLDDPIARMPLDARSRTLAGIEVPVIALPAFEASAPIKAELALRELGR
jgi:serine kinase of HPr protein (carbohydrate metabolism regulator)